MSSEANLSNAVGPVIRAGEVASAVIAAIEDDNPEQEVAVVDRGDYVRIHVDRRCRLTRSSLERHLGRPFDLSLLEIEMPSFVGRLETRHDAYVWYLERT
jgi:toluene monooxygenase system protein D